MNNKTKIVFMDFDGTLFSHMSYSIPDSTKIAIKKLQENGIKVFLCTGRAKIELENFDLSGVKLDGMVLSNGQVIYDQNENIIYDRPIEGILKEKILEIFNSNIVPIYLAGNDDLWLNFVNDTIIKVQNAISSEMPPVKKYNNEKFYMASAFMDTDEGKELIHSLEPYAEITYWHEGAVDLVPKGISKSIGIDETLKIYGIDISETMAIGDGENDISMLKRCQIGIAMGNSLDFVKDIADYVTDDIDEDGVYNALKHFELI